jgi:NADP-dependent 3-hydroxy acid dehydrogenase YdfG
MNNMKKTVIITGASSGIGLTAARMLASTNEWHVVLACRSMDKTNEAVKTITVGHENIEISLLDLNDLNNIQDFVKRWGNRKIDCLALNAGVHTGYVKEPVRSKQGFETTIATNHIGHFYLMNQLLPQVKNSPYGRIVIVGSEGTLNIAYIYILISAYVYIHVYTLNIASIYMYMYMHASCVNDIYICEVLYVLLYIAWHCFLLMIGYLCSECITRNHNQSSL